MVTADIPGAKRQEPYYKKTPHNYIDYNDVTRTTWVTSRHTNPLEPVYSHVDESSGHFTKVRQMCGINTSYGAIYGSKPSSIPPARKNPERFGTQDIIGAQADTKNCGAFTWMKRRQVREICTNEDILGSKASTLKRAVTTKRNCNPLNPEYVIPGHSEGFNIANDPYGQAFSSMGFANFQKAKNEGVKKMMSTVSEKVMSKASDLQSEKQSASKKSENKAPSEPKSAQESKKGPFSQASGAYQLE